MDHQQKSPLPAHVLIFPFPVQGHVNSMLNLAELLSIAAVHVTFLVSDFVHRRLLRHTDIHSRFSRYPGFRFQIISDGLPEDHSRAGGGVMDMIPSLRKVTRPQFRDMMVATDCLRSEDRGPVTCIIADGVLSFVGDFALEKGIQLVYFRTISACSFWAYFCSPEIIEADEVPLKGNGMDLLVKSVPGMEGFLRRRDLPGFYRVDDVSDPGFQFIQNETQQTPRANAIILNTIEELEGPVLSHIRTRMPNVFTIGPLHAHLKSRLLEGKKTTTTPQLTTASASFWEEDRSCIQWLDKKPPKSVIYVSFGSITVLSRDQLMEFWYGLVNSGQTFLWVIRPDSITGKDGESGIPVEVLEGTKERSYMVAWAPQEEVLNHRAIGGFFTHSGWNSTLESIIAGVPMICWPYFADQMVNSRYVSEVWKVGLDMKDTCDRVMIEKMVRDLMVERKDEFIRSAGLIAEMAKEAVNVGGSSYCNLDCLIEYIKSVNV